MRLSIITVNLNNREGLQKTIDSVICQTFRDFEWIVIDGGSTDGSRELIEQYADHFAYWVSEPDKGIYNAMNKGIKVAKGEYLQFLNSGDWLWDTTTLEKVFEQHFDEDILYGNNVETSGRVYISPADLDTLHFYRSTINHQASFTRASLLKENPYDESYKVVSDWLFYLKKIVFENASYRHLDIIITSGQAGCSYDPALYSSEREEILKKTFSPMQRTTLEKYAGLMDNPMRPYYNYIDKHPYLGKNIRRLVRMFCHITGNDTPDYIHDNNYRWASKLLLSEAHSLRLFDQTHCYTPNEISKFLSDKWIAKEKRGAGYWIWKPHIALLELEKMREDDILLYVDSGCTLRNTPRWREYLNILNTFDGIFMHFNSNINYGFTPTIRCWTKKNTIDYFSLKEKNGLIDMPQFIGGCFFIKKNEENIQFLTKWSNIMNSHQELVCDTTECEKIQDPAFIEHRHDQAILSLLLYTSKDNYNFYYLPEEIEWHDYQDNSYRAIIASRRNDEWIKANILTVIKQYIKHNTHTFKRFRCR